VIRVPLVETPYVNPVTNQGFAVLDCRILMVVYSCLMHMHIRVACVSVKNRVSWVNNDPELLFLHNQVQERDHDARDKVQERASES
jgi:hypothetical protein